MHRVCAVGLCSVLVAGAGTPVAWGETPEERCKRETESYNRLWQDAWVRNHPKEVAKGQQPPSPTPPYRCFGNDNPQQDMPGYTPPPGATIPPAGSAPGSGAPADTTPNSGGGAGEGASPGFLPESPNPLDDPAAGSDSYPYGSSYQDTWNSRRNHTPPSSSPATGNSPATAHGNGESATGNGLTGRGNGVNPKGTPPHSTPPANDTNPVKRWWKKLTHHPQRVETLETHQQLDARDPNPGNDQREMLRQVAENTQVLYQCATVPTVPSAGYPGRQRGYLSDATDLGYRIKVNGKTYGVFGDSFASPYQLPGPRTDDGKPYIRLHRSKAAKPMTIWELNQRGEPIRRVRLSGVPVGRYLPGGTIDGGGKGDLLMLSPVRGLNAGSSPGILYRAVPDGHGGFRLHRANKVPLPKNTSAISGFRTISPSGQPMYYFVTTTFQRDKRTGIVSWRATDITNPATWQWYDADHDQWIPYNPHGKDPTFIPGTGPLPHQKDAKFGIGEMYYRKLPDGTIVLAYLEGNKIKLRVSKALPQQFIAALTRVVAPVATVLPTRTRENIMHHASGVEAIAWAPEITLNIYDDRGRPVNQPYAPIIEPSTQSIRDLTMTVSQWSNPPGTKNMDKASRYATYPMTLGPLSDPAGLVCQAGHPRS